MRKQGMTLVAALLVVAIVCGCSAGTQRTDTPASAQSDMENAAALILDIPTTQYFTGEAVNQEDIDTILMAGANAPSAMNGQPWHFSAITDPAVIAEISGGMSFGGPPAGMTGMPEGAPAGGEMPAPPTVGGSAKAGIEDAPLVIVVSCKVGSEFDAGLACQNMSAEAQLLGYGTKIVSAPTMVINAEGQETLRATLGMPDGYTACALLMVGAEDTSVDTTADTYTGATTRNPLEELVTYLTP